MFLWTKTKAGGRRNARVIQINVSVANAPADSKECRDENRRKGWGRLHNFNSSVSAISLAEQPLSQASGGRRVRRSDSSQQGVQASRTTSMLRSCEREVREEGEVRCGEVRRKGGGGVEGGVRGGGEGEMKAQPGKALAWWVLGGWMGPLGLGSSRVWFSGRKWARLRTLRRGGAICSGKRNVTLPNSPAALSLGAGRARRGQRAATRRKVAPPSKYGHRYGKAPSGARSHRLVQ